MNNKLSLSLKTPLPNLGSPKDKTILIADDDPIACRILEKNLKIWGYETILAKNGEEAWLLLQKEDIRFALLDWMMPKIDGIELCRKIRSKDKAKYTYIILLTAKGHPQDIIDGLKAGADDFMTKPANFLELQARLQTGQRIIALEDKLLESHKRLYDLATKDSLTALWNRAIILEFLGEELARSLRENYPLGLIIIDVDNFKKINDTFGHQTGDLVLRLLSASLKKHIRPYDKTGRYGGDEMLILLPNCRLQQVGEIAERLRQGCEKIKLRIDDEQLSFTLSLGCASTEVFKRPSASSLIRAGDRALYRAKRSGRNCVVLSRETRLYKGKNLHETNPA